jgi:hypothetical protein
MSESLAAVDLILTSMNVLEKLELREQLLILGDVEQYGGAPALLGDNEWSSRPSNLLNERSGVCTKLRNRLHVLV